MKKRHMPVIALGLLMAFFMGNILHGESDLCNNVDMKPVLSLNQINQSELVFVINSVLNPNAAAPSGSPEDFYQQNVNQLVDAGFPPGFADIEPGRLVTRRYYSSIMFQVALMSDPEFASKYGSLTDETAQKQALVSEDYMYAEEGRIYREEILSVICRTDPFDDIVGAGALVPEIVKEGNIETPVSGL
jgi:hypothetical protein